MREKTEKPGLKSWKAIARYLGCSVRTARRWEATEGLPVHRQQHVSRASVYAYESELDAWQRRGELNQRPGALESTAVAQDTERSIAVLPFEFMGGEQQQEYVADGLTDEIISKLSGLPELRVTSRTSSMMFKGVKREARMIAGQLKVTHLLEGTTRVAGDALRVSARLIEPRRDEQLWTAQFDGTLEDVFSIQEKVARKIVDALELHLTPEQKRSLSTRSVDDTVAWRLMFQARQEAFRWRGEAIDRAVELLHRAIDIAGYNPQLLGSLGRTWLQYREAGIDLSEKPLSKAETCARRILDQDPAAVEGLQLKGWLAYTRGNVAQALDCLRMAIAAEPDDVDTLSLLVNCLLIAGLLDESEAHVERLLLIDPLTPLTSCMPGWKAVLQGRFSAAIQPYEKMLAMDPANPFARLFCIWAYVLNDKHEEVAEAFAEFPEEAMGHPAVQVAALFAGKSKGPVAPHTEAAAAENEMLARTLAQGLAVAGDYDGAERWLRTAMERGFTNYPYLSSFDPFFAPLRGRPGFEDVLKEMRKRWEALVNAT